ncbi:MAG TPA: hypothetical protein DIW80_23105 [Gordonia polyisoprenivorans]|uniref:Uncharacterized protein n=1 Tax=Gordonia polyisoprenivorans TaxID=84595 RepID=A0A846WNI4_9ACTN|nr:hypothetical protein [Gordonia polyisoprenivorans]NKY02929.1 hypothetical protein [Gordonia polyisoprenivorans]OZC32779.1 hypothetical protein CJJ17_15805 [Gordonia polyisoprenivorans]UZF56201.1 hypothetical protein LH935_26630 [Gordonia polyisoprenivorans]WCB37266.1 hypothetical protein PHA63_25070 [Gordonia polyisoprenivorans]GAB25014.1 hypothetical protein GOPIP_075_01120 [Gordonia polyisoprenivorans NBRC 16320 = JCM 10675]
MIDDGGMRGAARISGPSSGEIRQWCDRSAMPGERPELSDVAAILVASGYLTPTGRAIVIRRVSTGLPLPIVPGGFGEMRRLQRAIVQLEAQQSGPMVPGVIAAVMRNRLNGLVRRREDAHKAFVTGKGVFAGSTRAIRRERRENVYLELDERERLFAGLLCTPTPNVGTMRAVRRAGTVAVERIAGVVGQVAARSGNRQVEQWAEQVTAATDRDAQAPAVPGSANFVDGYEALLFIAGHYYDRIMTNPAWRSDHFAVQRTQVNLHSELAEIAADVIALRAVRVDLDRAKRNGGFDQAFAEQIDRRETTLRPVWSELIDRVQALSDVAHVVESAATELRILAEYNKAATIDDRIDALVARSGDREISMDNAKRLSEQVRSGEEQLRIYRDVLQGNISRLSPAVPRELPARYEPS